MEAKIEITAKTEGHGFMLSLASTGDYSGETLNNRFYSFDAEPPPGLRPEEFWGHLLGQVASFLTAD